METLRELDIVRTVPAGIGPVALRAATDDADEGSGSGLGRLVVRFSPFNVWYEIHSFWEGNFMERTVRGAFAKTMSESKNAIRCQFDHGMDFRVGNLVLCPTEELREDPDAAVLEGDLFDAPYNHDLLPGLRAGVYGASFRFRVVQDQWNDEPEPSEYNPKGLPERTLTELKLFEAGPVTYGASATATSGVRAMCGTDTYYERLRPRDASCDDLLARARALREPSAAAGKALLDAGAARTHPGEPVQHHSDGHGARQRRESIYGFLANRTVG